MKKLSLLIPLTCAALALAPFAPQASAQDAATPPPPNRERGFRGGQRGGPAPVQLTTEERQKLRAAVTKAKADAKVAEADKAVQEAIKKWTEARKAADKVTKEAVVAADPSLKDIVAKFGERPLPGTAGGFGGGPRGAAGQPPAAGAAGPRGQRGRRGANAPAPAPKAGE
ncbi:MAG: hypothetical protein LBT53_05125 [Puniceicoccales bacterium]|jgi:hypothetical protein|nr:hypothetical protein [Puniceicoccales bacterium]